MDERGPGRMVTNRDQLFHSQTGKRRGLATAIASSELCEGSGWGTLAAGAIGERGSGRRLEGRHSGDNGSRRRQGPRSRLDESAQAHAAQGQLAAAAIAGLAGKRRTGRRLHVRILAAALRAAPAAGHVRIGESTGRQRRQGRQREQQREGRSGSAADQTRVQLGAQHPWAKIISCAFRKAASVTTRRVRDLKVEICRNRRKIPRIRAYMVLRPAGLWFQGAVLKHAPISQLQMAESVANYELPKSSYASSHFYVAHPCAPGSSLGIAARQVSRGSGF